MPKDATIARVVIIDDSEIAQTFIERVLEVDDRIRVVGRAQNGAELLTLSELDIAQVLVLDVMMPGVTGLSLIKRLPAGCPVVIVSAFPQGSPLAVEALAFGAYAYFNKGDLTTAAEARRFRETIRSAAQLSGSAREIPRMAGCNASSHCQMVIAVGSTGAVEPLERLVVSLSEVKIPVLVVQHLTDGKAATLAQVLTAAGARAHVARDGEVLGPGVFLAPTGKHMEVSADSRIRLIDGRPVSGHIPSGDVLIRSVTRFGARVVAVVLSGLGSDGAEAMAALAKEGGACFALHPDDCQAPYMPRAALTASSLVKAVHLPYLELAVARAVGNG